MKYSVLFVLLFASILMNVFTLAGYVRARAQSQAEDPTSMVTKELGLSEEQSTRFRMLRSEMDEQTEFCRGNQALIRQEIMDELQADEPDAERITQLLEESAELERALREGAAQRFGAFVEQLAPEQRDALFRSMRHRGPGRGRPDRRLERFDKNRDGVLDEAERAEATAYFQSNDRHGGGRWQRGPGPGERGRPEGERGRPEGARGWSEDGLRRQLRHRFDADQDGALAEEELEALIGWLTGEKPVSN